MGFGTRLDIDLPNARKGYIPDTTFYNKWYPSGWNFYTIYSNSIGQGEVGVIPLQMANFAALVANRGWFISPHIVRNFGDETQKLKYKKYSEKHYSMIASDYWDIAVEGMYGVVHEGGGTARRARIEDIAVCGKTGTAANIGDDQSVFICFAPKNNPQIAVAVYIENAQGGGGTWAAPIASLIVEKHIRGTVEREEMEKYYIETNPCQPLPLKRKIKTKKK
jgi:penicillin-binding protein 2